MKKTSTLKRSWRLLVLIIIAITIAGIGYGQTQSIISLSSTSPSQLNSNQLEKYNKLISSSLNDSFKLVEIQNLSTCEINGKLILTLSGLPCPNLIFTRISIDYTSENEYYWHGFVDDTAEGSCKSGSLTLMAKNGEKFGTLIIDDNSYDIQDIGNGLQSLSRVKIELLDENECAVATDTIGNRSNLSFKNHNSGIIENTQLTGRILPCQPDCEVRVLVLWTQAAQNIEGNINNRIALAMAQTRQAYSNSLVDVASLNLVLAGSQLVNFTESNPGNMENDVFSLANDPAIQALRANLQADIVVLLTNGTYGAFQGVVREIGPNFNTAYAIVQTNAATTGRYTFAHEVGHLFGARHNNDINGTIGHGYTFRTGFIFTKKRYTLVTSTPGGKTREQYYSNPDIKIKNKFIGTADHNNNAQLLRNNGCVVANFFANPAPTASVTISAIQQDCYIGQAEAIVQCGTEPYNYSWEISLDNGSYVPISGNTDVVNFYFNCQTNVFGNLKVTVTDAASMTIVAYYHLELSSNYPAKVIFTPPVSSGTNDVSIIQRVFPNPANSSMQVDLLMSSAENVSIIILDQMGNFKKEIFKGILPKGNKTITVNTSVMKPGLYRIRVSGKNSTEYKQFIVTN